MFGWFGYLSLFGLFATAAITALSGVKGPVTQSTIFLGALTLILAVNLTDLIPNANLLPLTYLVAGSIAIVAQVLGLRAGASAPLPRRTIEQDRVELAN